MSDATDELMANTIAQQGQLSGTIPKVATKDSSQSLSYLDKSTQKKSTKSIIDDKEQEESYAGPDELFVNAEVLDYNMSMLFNNSNFLFFI